jgi:hypothetical protein
MATVTVATEEIPQPTVTRKTATLVLSEAEANRVAARLQQTPNVLGDDGGEIGLQIQIALG